MATDPKPTNIDLNQSSEERESLIEELTAMAPDDIDRPPSDADQATEQFAELQADVLGAGSLGIDLPTRDR